jgi:hypothetical protein
MLSKSVMCVLAPPMNSLSTMAWPAQIRDGGGTDSTPSLLRPRPVIG